jgi:hypothetical protein
VFGHGNLYGEFFSVSALSVGVLRRFHPPKPCALFVHSPVQLKISLIQKPRVEKNFVFSICPGCDLKSPLFVVVRKFMHHRNFCVETFSNPFEIFFAVSIESLHAHQLSSLLICQGCTGLPHRVLSQLEETSHSECADDSLPLQMF